MTKRMYLYPVEKEMEIKKIKFDFLKENIIYGIEYLTVNIIL